MISGEMRSAGKFEMVGKVCIDDMLHDPNGDLDTAIMKPDPTVV